MDEDDIHTVGEHIRKDILSQTYHRLLTHF